VLEKKLDQIFLQAHHWKAILLLDEADVFMPARSSSGFHNDLVSVYLRMLEYYRGIMFLTTNRIRDFDYAIQCRISVALCYPPLGLHMRRTVWGGFMEKVASTKSGAKYTGEDLDWLAQKEVNGRQVSC
jgi:SpoVK/Ycf46/Vps4 family AAA+-type ATPase